MNNKLTFIIFLTLLWASPIAAQDAETTTKSSCTIAGRDDVVGERMSIEVKRTDLSSVLNGFTDLMGCNFVIDKSVSRTVEVDSFTAIDQPWNVVLGDFLESQGLSVKGVSAPGSLIIIGTIRQSKPQDGVRGDGNAALITVKLQLKNLPTCGGADERDQVLVDGDRIKNLVSRRLSRLKLDVLNYLKRLAGSGDLTDVERVLDEKLRPIMEAEESGKVNKAA